MELKWLDDYIALMEAGTFSAAAERRHVSQPAFSRRIQMLEEWLGVTLIDRTRKPLQFTPVAAENQQAFRLLVASIYEFRAVLKSEAMGSSGITITAPHSLVSTHLPVFLERLRRLDAKHNFRIRAETRDDSLTLFMRDEAQILVTYETPQTACNISPQLATRHKLGQDELLFVASPSLHQTLACIPEGDVVPILGFPSNSFFGQVLRAQALPELMQRQAVVVRCVSEYSMGLRELALTGQGGAWLPGALIADDLKQGRLIQVKRLGRSVPMEIAAYIAIQRDQKTAELLERINGFVTAERIPSGRAAPARKQNKHK